MYTLWAFAVASQTGNRKAFELDCELANDIAERCTEAVSFDSLSGSNIIKLYLATYKSSNLQYKIWYTKV